MDFISFESLKDGQRIKMCWHFNSASGNHYWKTGHVKIDANGGRLFVPSDKTTCVLILPHRMDEIALIGDDQPNVQNCTDGETITNASQ